MKHLRFGGSGIQAVVWVLLLGCSAAEESREPRPAEEPSDLIDFDPAVNVCPRFEGSLILPQSLPAGASAFVAARATDPDSDDATLKYRWSSPSGEFLDPELPVTEYRCSRAGEERLTVVASDLAACEVELELAITCTDP